MAVQHAPAKRVDFAEGGRAESGAVEAKRESADAGEQVEDLQGWPPESAPVEPRGVKRIDAC